MKNAKTKFLLPFSVAIPSLCFADSEDKRALVSSVQEIQTTCPYDDQTRVDFENCDVDFWSVCGVAPPEKGELRTQKELDRIVDDFEREVIERLVQKYGAGASLTEASLDDPVWEPVDLEPVDPSRVTFDEPQAKFSPEFQAELEAEMKAYLTNFVLEVVPNTAWYAFHPVEGSEFSYVFVAPTGDPRAGPAVLLSDVSVRFQIECQPTLNEDR